MAVFIGGIGTTESDRDKFFRQLDQLSESQKKSLDKELSKEISKVDSIDWFRIPDKKAKQIYRQKMIQARKRAYKKFGIDYKASLLPKT